MRRSPDDPDDTRGRMAFARRMVAMAIGVDELPPDANVEMSIDAEGNCHVVGGVEIARYTYAEPAVQQTRQVVAVGVVMVVVFALALYTLSQHPNAMWAIAEMVSVIGIVFGGIFVAARYVKKRSETPPDYP